MASVVLVLVSRTRTRMPRAFEYENAYEYEKARRAIVPPRCVGCGGPAFWVAGAAVPATRASAVPDLPACGAASIACPPRRLGVNSPSGPSYRGPRIASEGSMMHRPRPHGVVLGAAGLAALLLGSFAGAQEAPPGGPPGAPAVDARALLAQAIATTLDLDGYQVSYRNLDPAGAPEAQNSVEVHRRPDFSWFRMAGGGGEIYVKGDRLVIKDPEKGTWASAEELGTPGTFLRARVRRADQVLQTVLEGADSVAVVRTEAVEGTACTVIQVRSSPETVERRTRERLAEAAVREGLARRGIADPIPALDRCSIEFTAWVDPARGWVRRLHTVNHLIVSTPAGDTDIAGSRRLEFSQLGEPGEIPLPEEVKARLAR
ncbi:MAG: hypothetical protein HZA54_11630 [Planctomycetes bacterium]|nr:hypothetical protein [Planctomycetota bacterium]